MSTLCQPLGEGKETHNQTTSGQSVQNAIETTPVEGVPQTPWLREDQKVPSPCPCHCVDRTSRANQGERLQLTFPAGAYTISARAPAKPALGKQVLPVLSTLLEFISICFFHLLSRIIVLLGLRAWEGKRCAFLFINSLNACFKLKPTPHAGLHRNNIKTHCLPACCYQYQSDINLLSLLTWGHPFWKHLAIT